jgi:hypothetical protein
MGEICIRACDWMGKNWHAYWKIGRDRERKEGESLLLGAS